ncbi:MULTISPECIES: YdcF family protein [unclassified Corynebacterium]|uniref:YdcF family protein n=1 Tax=unclassified Corynebacterium TaxID=2624378 RepID=UPI0030A6CAC4
MFAHSPLGSHVLRSVAVRNTLAVGTSAFSALLLNSGIRTHLDPLMRPPRLPNRRPTSWQLTAMGAVLGIGMAVALPIRRHAVANATAIAYLGASATPGFGLPVFEFIRRGWSCRSRGEASTIVVLGCALRNDEPSELLRRRLEKAVAVARRQDDPDSVLFICSGGVGSDTDTNSTKSEADVMATWLRDRGWVRVVKEEQSANTVENLRNSAALGVVGRVIVVTSDFHVLRVTKNVREAGLASAGQLWQVEGAPTPSRFWATSILREFLAQPVMVAQWAQQRGQKWARQWAQQSHSGEK